MQGIMPYKSCQNTAKNHGFLCVSWEFMKAVTKPCIYLKLFPKKCSSFNVTVSTIAFTSNKSITEEHITFSYNHEKI